MIVFPFFFIILYCRCNGQATQIVSATQFGDCFALLHKARNDDRFQAACYFISHLLPVIVQTEISAVIPTPHMAISKGMVTAEPRSVCLQRNRKVVF